jgi:transcription initiation factor IIF auxiliary subunit
MNELDFVYGNQVISSSRLAPRSQSVPWKLKVSLVDSKNEKNMISRLEITWHPSFPNPFTVLTEKDFPFERNGASWGMFTILFEARLIEPFAQEVLCFEHLLTIRGSGLMHSQKVYLVDETMVSST